MSGQSLLIVEDETIVAIDIKMRLKSLGYRVLGVTDSGDEAIELALREHPDLVLMDIKLKGATDGIAAAARLRERSAVPVIFVTAFTDDETLGRAKLVSPYGYIVKPFRERELRIAIELALYKSQYEASIRKAKELAEESNRLKGEFLANMSHELKTPLNSVIGFVELAIDLSSDAEQREYLRIALGSAKSLTTLIDSILDYSSLETGRLSLLPAPFSLDALLEEIVDILAVSAYSKGLEAHYRKEITVPDRLVADDHILSHVLSNLIDNAVKFTDHGTVRLRVDARRGREAEGRLDLVFEIEDTGIGIPPDKVDAAFDRFTQLDGSSRRRAGGAGLGLAIVKKSVDLLGGSIEVRSGKGGGTRITVTAPAELSFAPDEAGEKKGLGLGLACLGFDGESLSDLCAMSAAAGIDCLRVDGMEQAIASGLAILADEKAISDDSAGGLEAVAARLIVATRFGSGLRGMIKARGASRFVKMPLRVPCLLKALESLEGAPPALTRASSETTADEPLPMSPKAAAAEPSREGAGRPDGPERLAKRFADSLDSAAASGRFDLAESSAKLAYEESTASGREDLARLAFAALLLGRRGDGPALAALVQRLRSGLGTEDDVSGAAEPPRANE